jgi:hypothetical protein
MMKEAFEAGKSTGRAQDEIIRQLESERKRKLEAVIAAFEHACR